MGLVIVPANIQHSRRIILLTQEILGQKWDTPEAVAQINDELVSSTGRGRYYLLNSEEGDQAYVYLKRPEHTPRWIQLIRLVNQRTASLTDIELLLSTGEYRFKAEFFQATGNSPEGLFFQTQDTKPHQAAFYNQVGLSLGAKEEEREVWVKKYL